MVAIPNDRVTRVYSTGSQGEVTRVYHIENVDTGDTIDLSGDFNSIKVAVGTTEGVLTGSVVGGTTVNAVTLTLATMADTNVVLVVTGQAA